MRRIDLAQLQAFLLCADVQPDDIGPSSIAAKPLSFWKTFSNIGVPDGGFPLDLRMYMVRTWIATDNGEHTETVIIRYADGTTAQTIGPDPFIIENRVTPVTRIRPLSFLITGPTTLLFDVLLDDVLYGRFPLLVYRANQPA